MQFTVHWWSIDSQVHNESSNPHISTLSSYFMARWEKNFFLVRFLAGLLVTVQCVLYVSPFKGRAEIVSRSSSRWPFTMRRSKDVHQSVRFLHTHQRQDRLSQSEPTKEAFVGTRMSRSMADSASYHLPPTIDGMTRRGLHAMHRSEHLVESMLIRHNIRAVPTTIPVKTRVGCKLSHWNLITRIAAMKGKPL